MAIWRLLLDGGPRLARGPADAGPKELLPPELTIDGILSRGPDTLDLALTTTDTDPVPHDVRVLAPAEGQPAWAAGVTYRTSHDARREESGAPDIYERVYDAERPELFLKALAGHVRGPGEAVGIRVDSTWDVPEPELTIVADRRGEIAGYTIGNDMSSRSIEGENPLYLPQAKIYRGSAALGPCLVPVDEAPALEEMTIALRIRRADREVFAGDCPIAAMRRKPQDLVDWLWRANDFPVGVFLLTGTAVVPDAPFTLREGDEVTIEITGLGALTNRVEEIR